MKPYLETYLAWSDRRAALPYKGKAGCHTPSAETTPPGGGKAGTRLAPLFLGFIRVPPRTTPLGSDYFIAGIR